MLACRDCTPKYAKLYRTLINSDEYGVDGQLDDDAAAEKAVALVSELSQQVGTPTSLSSIGISDPDMHGMAKKAVGIRRPMDNNPRDLSVEDAANLYEAVR